MFTNYIKTAFRNLIKTRLFSVINILGLSIGMAACLLILHYVHFEKSYDKFHKDSDRIYRIRYERTADDGSIVKFASCCPAAAPFLRDRYPEVEKVGVLFRYRAVVIFGDLKFTETRMYFAQPEFFEIFDFKFIAGDPVKGIIGPNNAFLSRSTARKYFGNQDPMGKTFSVDKKIEYQVAGIFEDIQPNSHIKFDIILSFPTLEQLYEKDLFTSWGDTGFFTYVRLKPGADYKQFENRLIDLTEKETADILRENRLVIRLKVQPLSDIHLDSNFMQEYEPNGDRDSVNFLFVIALFTIVIAWVNYVNLSTARSLNRAKEVGLRKVVGASRSQLVTQFFMEIVLINFISVLVSLLLLKLALPFFTNITGTPVEYSIWNAGWFWMALPVMFVVGVILSGLYPVAVLSSFQPVVVLKGKFKNSLKGITLRKALVVFQFIMALVLIAGTLTVYQQIKFMKSQDLGFNMDQLLVVKAPRVRDNAFVEKFKTFKTQLLSRADIKKMCVVTEVPGSQILWDAGGIKWLGDTSLGKNYQIVGVDYDFANVFDLKLVAGHFFSREFPSDEQGLVLNETAVKWMGFKDAQSSIGQQIQYWDDIFKVIGVLKDFHQQSLKVDFEPHIFRFKPYGRDVRGHFAIKINAQNTPQIISFVEQNYREFFPQNPFEYFFLDEYFNRQYKSDELFGTVFGIFSFLSILVTSLGIFGLSSFMVVQRTKEIGIRKVMGASVFTILRLLVKDFMILIGISFVIALPLSILAIKWWLTNFAYRMSLNIFLFVLPVVIVSVITLITISAHIIREALANPIQALRYE